MTHKFIKFLQEKKVINNNQQWILDNLQYLVRVGSFCYGADHEQSDIDLYGVTIPPYEYINPFQKHIYGFDVKVPTFEQTVIAHIPYEETEIDIQVFNITKYFRLCLENNPNMIETLFVDHTCRLMETQNVGSHIRNNRGLFLTKNLYIKLKSYAYSQLVKCRSQTREGKRKEIIEKHGYETKMASHIFRLLSECEQFLTLDVNDIDLRSNGEELKAIKRGERTLEWIEEQFKLRETHLELAYAQSKLPYGPDYSAIRSLLYECLEMHFGAIDRAEKDNKQLVTELKTLIAKYE
jgi:predicted nucleotidyltransferase